MPLIAADALTKTFQKQFISAVDTGNRDLVHLLLEKPGAKAAMGGELGDHAVHNLDAWIPRLQSNVADELKYSSSALDAAHDTALLGRFKLIVGELKDAGARLTDRLSKFLAS
jgi:hypothetical protein